MGKKMIAFVGKGKEVTYIEQPIEKYFDAYLVGPITITLLKMLQK